MPTRKNLYNRREKPAPVPGNFDAMQLDDDEENEKTPLTEGDAETLTELDDGSMVADAEDGPDKDDDAYAHDANLAEHLDDIALSSIEQEISEGVEADEGTRKDWETTFTEGLKLLGLKLESPTSGVSADGYVSKITDPLMLDALIRYQSNFRAEMLPAEGPVKVRDDRPNTPSSDGISASPLMGHNGGPPLDDAGAGMGAAPPVPTGPPVSGLAAAAMPPKIPVSPPPRQMAPGIPKPLPPAIGSPAPALPPPVPGGMGGGLAAAAAAQPSPLAGPKPLSRAELAEAFQKDYNHYLTVVDKGYYPDTDRMSFSQGFIGCAFKKIYRDPIKRRPLSRFVSAADLIVSNDATCLEDAGRVTHRTKMKQSIVKRMQLLGIYINVDLSTPVDDTPTTDQAIADQAGIKTSVDRTEDIEFTIYETYCDLDIPGFEHTDEDGMATGLPLPYRVTWEKDSRQILEIRRDWKEGDDDYTKRVHFVKFPFLPGLGFYDYGFVNVLGNTTRGATALQRLLIDAGQFANFPGGLIVKQAGRQETNQIRLGPGTWKQIDVPTGGKIGDMAMPMPYKEPSTVLRQLCLDIIENGRRLAATTDLPVGEGKADIPVGTMIAMIEQATKVIGAIHKRNHTAQQEEFELMRELFVEDPAALWKFAKKPARRWEMAQEFADMELVPASDPNVPSHIHRIMQAVALIQLLQSANGVLAPKPVLERVLRILGVQDVGELWAPPQSAENNPQVLEKKAELALQAQNQQREAETSVLDHKARMAELQVESADRKADRDGRIEVAILNFKREIMKHTTPSGGDVHRANHEKSSQPKGNGIGSSGRII